MLQIRKPWTLFQKYERKLLGVVAGPPIWQYDEAVVGDQPVRARREEPDFALRPR